jgi:hypothetical protein
LVIFSRDSPATSVLMLEASFQRSPPSTFSVWSLPVPMAC